MREFALINRIREQFSTRKPEVSLGIGDDCALLSPNTTLAISTDTFVEGTHFFKGTAARAIGHKAIAVNLSDLAAMGAKPLCFLLNLTLPNADDQFVNELLAGMHVLAERYHCALIGGDTTRGPLSITITVFGKCDVAHALLRSGARPADRIFVARHLGAAAAAVYARQHQLAEAPELSDALDFVHPQIELGLALRGVASAAIDLSDGLVNDLTHICTQSGLRAVLDANRIPIAPVIYQLPNVSDLQALQFAANGGDDYALCFCAPQTRTEELHVICASLDLKLYDIGQMLALDASSPPSVQIVRDGQPIEVGDGYHHF
jgi:thiamine-monophosphate kinase